MPGETAMLPTPGRVRNFSGPLEDRIAIRELLDSYADSITRRDGDLWGSCWASAGRWKPGADIFEGRERIVAQWTGMMKDGHGMKGAYTRLFLNTPGSIVISGDEGEGWAYTNELIVDHKHMTYHLNGIYTDRYVREDGRWVFQERVFRKLHIDRPY